MKKDIAIVGMSGRFPKSDTIDGFWKNLLDEKELIHFYSDSELENLGVQQKDLSNANYVKAASFIDNVESFDYPFFKYTPAEVNFMNPQTRLLHQLVWEALEDAGCDTERFAKKIGIFVGAHNDLNWSLYAATSQDNSIDSFSKTYLSDPSFMASMAAFKLNLKGPCYYVDTACSTSLSTIHLACRSLLLNECNVAVTGGIRVNSFNDVGYLYQEGMIESIDGHCKTFDADASGTIGAEGAGLVILKRLEDAINDNDQIYAVIKASAMNNDGNRKPGYSMPSIQGQVECIKLAHKIAGIQSKDITYIEAHGTATKVGDPIEIESLNKAFDNDINHKCDIGSVKSNIGHSDEAAGVVSLIKTALSIKNGIIPASINFENTNPLINFKNGPFSVVTKTKKWERKNNTPLIAGVNCFGVGGTNVHVVLQENENRNNTSSINQRAYKLIQYSAKTLSSLEAYEVKLAKFLKENKNTNLADLAYTFQVGRKQFGYSKYIIARNIEETIAVLESKENPYQEIDKKERIVFMFPGQGSQYYKMGAELYEEEAYFKEILDQGLEILSEIDNTNYKEILFNHADSSLINVTEYTQPILFLFEYALAKTLIKWGIQPDYLIGHSLGEYVAAAVSEVFSFEDALKLIVKRGKLMSSLQEGIMLSVEADYEKFDKTILAGVSLAAVNSPGNFVMSGTQDEIESIKALCLLNEISCVQLKTSHAFHSKMMLPIVEELKEYLSNITLSKPSIQYISNVSGQLITNEEVTSPDYWIKHLLEPVYYAKGLKTLTNMGNTVFVEVGPGKTLTGLFRQINSREKENVVIQTIKHPKEETSDKAFLLKAISKLNSYGFSLNWESYYQQETRNKISLPTYAFDDYTFPVRVKPYENLSQNKIRKNDNQEKHLYYQSWKYSPVESQHEEKEIENVLLFIDKEEKAGQIAAVLSKRNVHTIVVNKEETFRADGNSIGINPESPENYKALFDYLKNNNLAFSTVIYSWGVDSPKELNSNYSEYLRTTHHFIAILKELSGHLAHNPLKIVNISLNNIEVLGGEKADYTSGLASVLQVFSEENPGLKSISIDVDDFDAFTCESIINEIKKEKKFYRIAYRNKRKWECAFEPLPAVEQDHSGKKEIKARGNYLVIGELHAHNRIILNHLIGNYKAQVFLINQEDYDSPKDDNQLLDVFRSSGKLTHVNCSLLDFDKLTNEIQDIELRHGKIDGLIYAERNTGLENFPVIESISEKTLEAHFSEKINGISNLYQILQNKDLDFVKVISSMSVFSGGISYGTYAASYALLDDIVLNISAHTKSWSLLNVCGISATAAQTVSPEEFALAFENSLKYSQIKQLLVFNETSGKVKNTVPQKRTNKDSSSNKNYRAAETATEKEITSLFEEFFGISGIGTEEDFFEYGLDSLKGISVTKRIEKQFEVSINIDELYKKNTIKELAGLIDEKLWLTEKHKTSNHILI